MVFVIERLKRSTALAAAVLLLLASSAPLLVGQTASAYTLLGDREIKMSTSEGGATGVTHAADFNISTTGDVGGIVVTFCENSPIIGDTSCVEPTGLSLSATVANADAGDQDLSGWTAAVGSHSDAGTADNTFFLTNATAVSMTADDNIMFEMTSAENPDDIGTFYARIMTYATETDANNYTIGGTGDEVDAGGIALSTAELITIEAKVQERITFCVFATDGALSYDETDCSAVTDPVQLGDANGVLDSSNPSISKDAKFNITTNASTGATIRMKGNTLETGSFSVDPVGDVSAGDGVAVASDPGTEQFGLCTYRDTGGGVTGLDPTAPYDDSGNGNCAGTTDGQGAGNDNGALFAFDEAELSTSLYGHSLATKTAGDWSTGVLVFLGNVSNTTEPGIYTTTLDFIATGRY